MSLGWHRTLQMLVLDAVSMKQIERNIVDEVVFKSCEKERERERRK